MPPEQLRQILGKCRAGQHHVAANFVRPLLQVSLDVRKKTDDRGLLQLALELRDESKRLYVRVVQVEDDQRRFLIAIGAQAFRQILLGLHEFHFDVHLAARLLDLRQEKQVLDKSENAWRRIVLLSWQWLGIGRAERGKSAAASAAMAAIAAAHFRAIAMVHRGRVDPLMLLTVSAHRASGASAGRTTAPAPFMFPSASGGMSRSCIHIVLLFTRPTQA